MSANKAGVDLRETSPLPRNTLHTSEVKAHRYTGQRTSQKVTLSLTGYRAWKGHSSRSKVSADHLTYSADVRDTAKSGIGYHANRHLNYLVESISMNVGGSQQNAKVSSLPMSAERVGGVIVGAPRSAGREWRNGNCQYSRGPFRWAAKFWDVASMGSPLR